MTFRRSPSALGSLKLFYRVDVVAFCEGGTSLSHEDALNQAIVEDTMDTLFWSHVAEHVGHGRTIYFKSVGNKDTLCRILDDIITTGCDTVSVCMDSDYDEHIGIIVNHPRAAKTMGYSWESDVLSRPVVYQILSHLIGPASASRVKRELDEILDRLENHLVKWCEIDIALKARSKPCILSRKKPGSVIDVTCFPPILNVTVMENRLSEIGYRTRPKAVVKVSSDRVLGTICGKTIGRMIFNITVTIARRFNSRLRIEYDNFMRIAVRETFTMLRAKSLPRLDAHLRQHAGAFQ